MTYHVLDLTKNPAVKRLNDVTASNLTEALAKARAKYGHNVFVEESSK
jgi:hypothetical protein